MRDVESILEDLAEVDRQGSALRAAHEAGTAPDDLASQVMVLAKTRAALKVELGEHGLALTGDDQAAPPPPDPQQPLRQLVADLGVEFPRARPWLLAGAAVLAGVIFAIQQRAEA